MRLAGAGAVEVDDVQEARAGRDPGARGLQRVVVVGRGVLEAALDEADRLAVHDVDRGVEDHATATAASWAKLRSMRSPSREDFSGWNCAAITLPRSTTDTKRSPYSLVPDDVGCASDGPAGEGVHVVEGRGVAEALGQRATRARSVTRFQPMCGSRGDSQPRDRRRAGCPGRARPRARCEDSNSSCMPRQMPEQRHAGGGALDQHLAEAGALEVAHRLREGADAGQDHARPRRGSRRGRR